MTKYQDSKITSQNYLGNTKKKNFFQCISSFHCHSRDARFKSTFRIWLPWIKSYFFTSSCKRNKSGRVALLRRKQLLSNVLQFILKRLFTVRYYIIREPAHVVYNKLTKYVQVKRSHFFRSFSKILEVKRVCIDCDFFKLSY
jgi:hypothetical protein